MRKIATGAVASLALCSLITGAAGAQAANKARPVKKHTRTFTFTYTAGPTTHSFAGVGSTQGCIGAAANCFAVDVAKDEKYLTLSSTDATGRPVGLSMWPDTGTTGISTETFVCGGGKNLSVAPRSTFTLSADTVSVDPSCAGAAPKGTIVVKLSNLP
jgi:hypothetical protein